MKKRSKGQQLADAIAEVYRQVSAEDVSRAIVRELKKKKTSAAPDIDVYPPSEAALEPGLG